MKKQNSLIAYILIGIGLFFLLRQLKIPIITDFYSWQTILIIVGIILLFHSYSTKSYQNILSGTIVLGLGIHFHGLAHYRFWIDHWAVYILIVGIAFILRATKTKRGFIIGLLLTTLSILLIFSTKVPVYFQWIYDVVHLIEQFWPIILIIIGIYMIKKKK
ncbi:LiaI-LiaF-like domain-containing protein [Oceanobacillus halophilus]|uniref:LiaF transmembrane domain-containing protein n=1 Tax=Oceanobacillus halophilus TaxID=930130 RepID=A0A495AD76_9BACI|nr:DUF5668 domain-containing protein [Oceanobacillus halophilus]RKQ37927.1 hypothetical protein D8M06_03770 [Oceanobacillus halophilus]